MTTRIGKVAYIATWDASQLTKGMMTSRQQFAAQKKIVEDSQTPLQRYTNGLENLRVLVSKYPHVLKQQGQIQKDLNRQYLEAERNVRKLTASEQARYDMLRREHRRTQVVNAKLATPTPLAKASDSFGMAALPGMGLAGLGAAGGAAMAARKVFDIAREGTRTFAELERSTAAFEVFTGSAKRADQLTKSMRNLSMQTGVQMNALQGSASTMMGFGVALDQVVPKMTQMAAITRGDSERLRSMSLAFAQVTAAGRLMGQDLLQLVNSGFNPLQEISRKTGRSIIDLKKDMELGKISAQEVSDAFDSVVGQGGLYNGMLEKMADTTSVQLAKASGAWQMFSAEVGESLSPLTRAMAQMQSDVLNGAATGMRAFDPSRKLEDRIQARFDIAKDDSFGRFLQTALNPLVNQINPLLSNVTPFLSKLGSPSKGDLNRAVDLDKQIEEFKKINAEFLELRNEIAAGDNGKAADALKEELRLRMEADDKFIARMEGRNKAWAAEQERMKVERERLEARGQHLMQQFESPIEKMERAISEITALRFNRAIDDKTFNRARSDAIDRAMSERRIERPAFANSIERGSQEAARLQMGQMSKDDTQAKLAEKQLTVQKAIAAEAKKTRQLLASQPKLKKI